MPQDDQVKPAQAPAKKPPHQSLGQERAKSERDFDSRLRAFVANNPIGPALYKIITSIHQLTDELDRATPDIREMDFLVGEAKSITGTTQKQINIINNNIKSFLNDKTKQKNLQYVLAEQRKEISKDVSDLSVVLDNLENILRSAKATVTRMKTITDRDFSATPSAPPPRAKTDDFPTQPAPKPDAAKVAPAAPTEPTTDEPDSDDETEDDDEEGLK